MAQLTIPTDWTRLTTELQCYLTTSARTLTLQVPNRIEHSQYEALQYRYRLPLGSIEIVVATLYLPIDSTLDAINAARLTLVKAVLTSIRCQKTAGQLPINDTHQRVCVVDIRLTDDTNSAGTPIAATTSVRLPHQFDPQYFNEELVIDLNDHAQQVQIFSWPDWQTLQTVLITPCELYRFLDYRMQQLQSTSAHDVSKSIAATMTSLMSSQALFAQAIEIDNALIKYGMQDKPNAALVTMSLAQNNNSASKEMYHEHVQQAATLWSQLSAQMIEVVHERYEVTEHDKQETQPFLHWQQQLLDESLFSRHELVRTLYRHPKQSKALQESGYVVHQHSYERLGRHYVLIFYGEDKASQHNKTAIRSNLESIAKDVATRLPMTELHHIVVMGIEFIVENDDTFIDIDLWIQPVQAMSERERQLTKYIQRLQQQRADNSK